MPCKVVDPRTQPDARRYEDTQPCLLAACGDRRPPRPLGTWAALGPISAPMPASPSSRRGSRAPPPATCGGPQPSRGAARGSHGIRGGPGPKRRPDQASTAVAERKPSYDERTRTAGRGTPSSTMRQPIPGLRVESSARHQPPGPIAVPFPKRSPRRDSAAVRIASPFTCSVHPTDFDTNIRGDSQDATSAIGGRSMPSKIRSRH